MLKRMFGSDLRLVQVNRITKITYICVCVCVHIHVLVCTPMYTHVYIYSSYIRIYIQEIHIQELYIDSRYIGIQDVYRFKIYINLPSLRGGIL